MKTPETKREWQEAVDLAELHLRIDSAKKYGLLEGGPNINVERCEHILQEGAARGFKPDQLTVEAMAVLMAAGRP